MNGLLATRGNRFLFWRSLQRTCIVTGFSGLAGTLGIFVSCIVMSVITGNMNYDHLVVLTPFTGFVTWMSAWLYTISENKVKTFSDPRFKPYSYALTLKLLRRLGVKQPVKYLEDNDPNVDAYLRTLNVVRFRIGMPKHKTEKKSVFQFRKPSNELVEEHRVAALVLPGHTELSREPRIEHLINDRGLSSYDDIIELLEQNDDEPSTLSEGIL